MLLWVACAPSLSAPSVPEAGGAPLTEGHAEFVTTWRPKFKELRKQNEYYESELTWLPAEGIITSDCSTAKWCPALNTTLGECQRRCDHAHICGAVNYNETDGRCWLRRNRWKRRAFEVGDEGVGYEPPKQGCGSNIKLHYFFVPYGTNEDPEPKWRESWENLTVKYHETVPADTCRLDWVLHSFAGVARLLDHIDPALEYLFKRINPKYPALRADVAKLALLHAHGGIVHDESTAPSDLKGFQKVAEELGSRDAVLQLQGPARGPNRGTWRAVNTNMAVSRRLSEITHGLLRVTKCRLLQQLRLVEEGSAQANESSHNLFWVGAQTLVDFVQETFPDVEWRNDMDIDGKKRVAPFVRAHGLRSNESYTAFYWPFKRTNEMRELSKLRARTLQHWSQVKDELLFSPRPDDEPLPSRLGSVDDWPKSKDECAVSQVLDSLGWPRPNQAGKRHGLMIPGPNDDPSLWSGKDKWALLSEVGEA